ncbi:hypothetical protein [Motilimonas eburnea]|uniref:hypothetical protein n=1 Tax=Motilimonas eburnea TaxID=1737488 RepID=UPI001E5A7BD7|nr:hypothetical protein [Motilimonas eburnea]MCE2570510.1 hypothetical protein [Motilimonas eburnea]
MKLAKRQARAKNKKQKYNQQKALKAQRLAERKQNASRPAVAQKPKAEPVVEPIQQATQSVEPAQPAAVEKTESEPSVASTFSVNHPLDTITAIEKAIEKDEFTPTLLGKLFDVGAAKINTLLEQLGLQTAKEPGKPREVSAAGEAYVAKAKAAGFTWKFAVVEPLASLNDLTLDQDLVDPQYRQFALAE